MGGGSPPGPTCCEAFGTQSADAGTNCRWCSPRPGPNGVDAGSSWGASDPDDPEHGGYLWETAKGHWVFSEFPRQTISMKKPPPRVEMTIKVDEANLSIGKARYTGAVHLNKNLAIHPGGPGNAGTPMVHSNIEFHLKVDGIIVPMTVRRVRYWDIRFAKGATVANEGAWEVDRSAGATPVWDAPGTEDAPAMNFISQPKVTIGDMHEFIAGTPKYGGFYYQVVTMYDPDGTSRAMVYNLRPIDASQLVDAKRRVDRGADRHTFLFDAQLTDENRHSDSGIMTDIPDIVHRKAVKSK